MSVEEVQIKSLNECTLDQINELWNVGFQEYFNDMTRGVEQTVNHLGACSIKPNLSVAAYIDGVPAGFVFIGLKNVHGVKTAWNGGTGVNPLFRGRGIAKILLQEAIARLREADVDMITLEVRTENSNAISAYIRAGFQSIHSLPVLVRNGAFEQVPFQRSRFDDYLNVYGIPEDVSRLPFYLEQSAWMMNWFNLTAGAQSLIVYDRSGEVAGYSLFIRSFTKSGELSGITLYHCEANPKREDGSDVVRYMLAQVYGPFDVPVRRVAHYLRSTNQAAIDALAEVGFTVDYEEQLMRLHLK
ncbi:GNAT family N-acetyltransferase [Paenibacillus eucommiae]|uniref:Ribosomal protein S18 acetylase RimI-like enzyme n=1 Tax=Paenibacillus eucommiae TaxID=1355755 RepID=A0ABS4INP4_9BACL|nr:GNAT family N-acetyltransferase [Paenibacillus eucommiae]MBP1988541.1 ribosomal protein S18 acetylase RimI-like enzyme [Paenibacillus eucommiae]